MSQGNITFHKVKGFQDIYGNDCAYWHKTEAVMKEVAYLFNIDEIRLPVLEYTSVFDRGVGSTTDIVEKEMFTFLDRDSASQKGESLSLRPEGTAGVVRAYIENGMYSPPLLKKFYYLGPMFRRERPQKGRFRQFTQAGVEYLGSSSPAADADVISIMSTFFEKAGLEGWVSLEINSVGCSECRPAYHRKLLEYLALYKDVLCGDCLRRMETNPLRILDCKVDRCKEVTSKAPYMIDHLCGGCEEHFDGVKYFLNLLGVQYKINPLMVRGLDYYVRTAFEMVTDKLGSASAAGAGGRYDGLVETLGGPPTPGIGFAIGMDRVVELMKMRCAQEGESICLPSPDVFIITFGGVSLDAGIRLMSDLRKNSISAILDYEVKGMKNQMKQADRAGASFAVIIGEDELSGGTYTVRNLKCGEQFSISSDELIDRLKADLI